ncbi:CpsB/CapC family capsule biosynthesis tyrosine phosphatase [Olsenella profusa]|uniref:protein-tyrosine-phosphatase n=1 Tax=Olsenella profusa TaxID=138595 RepID=A0ABS2F284_9ACTN|nr:CpsB/CapC family capsule biosynthesis tyrosine phosphatase [Olsenella profusa]MBM6774928.1 phosphoesterase [Olsenella profusa]
MRDIHSHILPGVDDGARDLAMSLDMLEAARAAGVTSIVCTPHARDPYFDYDAMWAAYEDLRAHAGGFPLQMGFEVAHAKLVELGVSEWAPRLAFDGTNEFLLELDPGCSEASFAGYERTIFELQGMGYDVIIAHPERYRAIQRNVGLAARLVRMGCKLQASADFVAGGRLGRERRPARKMFDQLLYRYIASDAHRPEHYALLAEAVRDYPTRGAHAGVP